MHLVTDTHAHTHTVIIYTYHYKQNESLGDVSCTLETVIVAANHYSYRFQVKDGTLVNDVGSSMSGFASKVSTACHV